MLFILSFVAAVADGVTLPLTNVLVGEFVTAFNDFAVGQLSPERYMAQVRKLA